MLAIDAQRHLSDGDRASRDEKPPERDEQLFGENGRTVA